MLSTSQQNYLDICIHNKNCRNMISSKYEFEFKKIMNEFGRENRDWFHQFAYYDEELGVICVADFAIPKYEIVIELDGNSHRYKAQKEKDAKRDLIFYSNDIMPIRFKTPIKDWNYVYQFIKESMEIKKKEISKRKSKKTVKLFTDRQLKERIKYYFNNKA